MMAAVNAAKFGGGESSPNRKRLVTPPLEALGLDSGSPKLSGKALEEFVNFTTSEDQRSHPKHDEIEDLRNFSKELDRVRLSYPFVPISVLTVLSSRRSLASPRPRLRRQRASFLLLQPPAAPRYAFFAIKLYIPHRLLECEHYSQHDSQQTSDVQPQCARVHP